MTVSTKLNIEVPSQSIGGELSRHFLNSSSAEQYARLQPSPLEVALPQVKQVFYVALGILEELFDPLPEEITVEMQDDLGKIRPDRLGEFSLYRSELAGHIVFSISSYYLKELLEQRVAGDGSGCDEMQNTILHELVHAADWHTLQVFNAKREVDSEKYIEAHAGDFRCFQSFDGLTPPEWRLMSTLEHYRSEGLACLFGALTQRDPAWLKSGKDAAKTFSSGTSALLQYCCARKSSCGMPGDAEAAVEQLLETLHAQSYAVGPWLMMDVLVCAGELSLEDLRNVELALSGEGSPLSDSCTVSVVRKGLSMDFGVCMHALCRDDGEHPWGHFLETEELMQTVHYLTVPQADAHEYGTSVQELVKAAGAGDVEHFIQPLKDVLGSSMGASEIEEGWRVLDQDKSRGTGVEQRVLQRGAEVMALWRENKAEYLQWALTFLLDPEDIIDDSCHYLGYMDDLYVLEAALLLSRKKSTEAYS